MLFKTKGFIEPKGSRRDFEGGFFGISSTLIDAHTLPGQKACVCALMQATEGLKVGCGWVGGGMGGFKEWVGGGMGGWVGRGMGGLQKLITFFSGWAGLQKLITDLDMRNGLKPKVL